MDNGKTHGAGSVTWRSHSGRKLLFVDGYRAALTRARADFVALEEKWRRAYERIFQEAERLREETEQLKTEIASLRLLLGLRDPALPLN